jgi:hypothetical protein
LGNLSFASVQIQFFPIWIVILSYAAMIWVINSIYRNKKTPAGST